MKLVAAMEDLENQVNGDGAVIDAETPVVTPEVEITVTEATQDTGEVTELTDAVGDAVADTETLGDVQEVMDDSVEKNEGLDEPAAEIAEVAVESIRIRLGISGKSVFPATENFGSTSSRVHATRVASEGIGDMIKAAWEAIKRAFKAMWAKIVALYKRIFDSFGHVSDAAKKLKERVANLEGTASGDGKIPAKAFWSLSVGGKLNAGTAEDILKAQLGVTSCVAALGNGVSEGVKAVEEAVKAGSSSVDDAKAALGKAAESFSKDIVAKSMGAMTEGAAKGQLQNASNAIVTKPLLGGVRLNVAVFGGNDNSAPYVTVVETKDVSQEPAADATIPALSITEMKGMADQIVALASAASALKAEGKEIGNIEKKFNSAIDAAIKAATSEKDGEAGKALKQKTDIARQFVAHLGRATGTLFAKVPTMSIKTCRDAMYMVEASAKLYSAKK